MLKVRLYHSLEKDIHEKYLSRSKNFALIQIKPQALNQSKVPVHLLLTIDVSGSMDSSDSKSQKTKLDYVKTTVSSIITYLRTLSEYDIVISIIAFNEEATKICQYLRVSDLTQETVNQILLKMNADGCTNIYQALSCGSSVVHNFPQFFGSNPQLVSKYSEPSAFKTVNIFLTDGEITRGENRPEKLIAVASLDKMELSLLGYGNDHDPILLNRLSQLSKGEYTFVDSYEFAGAVYGDVLGSILNPAWQDVKIEIENGSIYNYETDSWESFLLIPRIGDEEEKSFSARLTSESIVTITYRDVTGCRGILNTEISTIRQTHNDFVKEHTGSLKLYWMRQLTMEVMHGVLISDKIMRGANLETRCKQIESYLKAFEMKYDIELNPAETQLLKSLNDDIHVARKCIQAPKDKSAMYLGARVRAQGRQRAYNMTNLEGLSQEDDGYVMSQSRVSNFASPSAARIMKTVSHLSGQSLD